MKRLEILSVAVVLGVGSVVGFAGARWGLGDFAGKGGHAPHPISTATPGPPPAVAEPATPVAAADRLEAIMSDGLQSSRLVALDRYCEGLDLEAVRRAAASMPVRDTLKNRELRTRLLSRWAELDAPAAAAFAFGMKNDNMWENPLRDVLKVWVSEDPDAARQFVAVMMDKFSGGAIQAPLARRLERINWEGIPASLAGLLAERDLEDALKFADAIPAAHGGSDREGAVREAFVTAGHLNPSAAVARAMTMPEGDLRESAISSAMRAWFDKNPQAAMAWVMQRPDMPGGYGRTLMENAVPRWAEFDPGAATRFVQNLPPGKQRDNLISAVATTLVYRDADQARQWVLSLPDDGAKAEALRRVVMVWSSNDPVAAAAFVARQPDNGNTGRMLWFVGRSWSAMDPEGALVWASAQPAGTFAKEIASQALGAIAAEDPARAIAALDALRAPDVRAAATAAIAGRWAINDPQAAARWLLELPKTDANSAALQGAISSWTPGDPAVVARWLETLNGDPRRDVAVEAFARAAQAYDPATAAAWANTISDAGTRRPLVMDLVGAIAKFDAPAAREWVLGQSLDAVERKALFDQIDRQAKEK